MYFIINVGNQTSVLRALSTEPRALSFPINHQRLHTLLTNQGEIHSTFFPHSFFNDHTCWHCSVCSGCLSSRSLLKILFQWHNLNSSSSLWAAICKTDVNKMLQDATDCLILSRLIISLSVSESVLKIPQNRLLILGLKKECFWRNPVFI